MQSSDLLIESPSPVAEPAWLEKFGLAEKLPVAVIFGCLLGLSSASFGLWALAWFGLVPLMVLVRGARTKFEAIFVGWAFGTGYHLVGLSWYLGLYPLHWLGLEDLFGIQLAAVVWLIESLHEALLFAAFAWLIYCLPMRAGFVPAIKRPYFPYILSLPLIWVFIQWVIGNSEFFLALPVNELAYSQYTNLSFLQISKYGGAQLLDFIIVLANTAIAALLLDFSNLARSYGNRIDQFSARIGPTIDGAIVAIALNALFFLGGAQLQDIEEAARIDNEQNPKLQLPNVPIAIVQPSISVEEERLKTTSPAEISKRVADLSTGHGAAMIFYSEGLLTDPQLNNGLLMDRLRQLSGQEKKEIIVGSVENFENHRVNTARLITFQPTKELVYIKQRLVPFGEFAPLGSFGQDISSKIERHAKSPSEKFLPGNKAHLLQTLFGKIGASIGLEVIYPHLISSEVRQGANLLVNISNLGWFHASSLTKELIAAGAIRAVENGRYLVIASNTGISAVIDPGGVVKSQSLAGKRGVILDTVQFLYKSTPYSRMWWL
jgi:apolipoprotein N-acyltransferase